LLFLWMLWFGPCRQQLLLLLLHFSISEMATDF
jgi:hypothetical protein